MPRFIRILSLIILSLALFSAGCKKQTSESKGLLPPPLLKVKGNLITMNEGRELLGYPPRDDMDVTLAEFLEEKGLKISASASPVDELVDQFGRTLTAINDRLDSFDQTLTDVLIDGEGAAVHNDQVEPTKQEDR